MSESFQSTFFELLSKSFENFLDEKNVSLEESNFLSMFRRFVTEGSKDGPTVPSSRKTVRKTGGKKGVRHYATFQEVLDQYNSGAPRCAYVISKGEHIGTYCGAAATNVDEVSNPEQLRCNACKDKGKRSENKTASSKNKVSTSRQVPGINTVPVTSVRAPAPTSKAYKTVSSKMVTGANEEHIIGASQDIKGFVFELDEDGNPTTCIGKLPNPDAKQLKSGYEENLIALTTKEAAMLSSQYDIKFMNKNVVKVEKIDDEDEDEDEDDDESSENNNMDIKIATKSLKVEKPSDSDDEDEDDEEPVSSPVVKQISTKKIPLVTTKKRSLPKQNLE